MESFSESLLQTQLYYSDQCEAWAPTHVSAKHFISSMGRLMRVDDEFLYKPYPYKSGYTRYSFSVNAKRTYEMAHRLVAHAFLPNYEQKATVDHINRQVDDNRLDNLRWATIHDQNANKCKTKRSATPVGVYKDGVLIQSYESLDELLKANGRKPRSIKLGNGIGRQDIIPGHVIMRLDHQAYDGEEWRAISYPNTTFMHEYKVSSHGRVWLQRGPSKGYKTANGYKSVDLYVEGPKKRIVFAVHRLVAAVFLETPRPIHELVVNHKNGDREDNAASNLEWCTQRENAIHSMNVLNTHILKKVACYDGDSRELVKIYPSMQNARAETGAYHTSLRSAIRTKGLASGFFWRYVESDELTPTQLPESECRKYVCKVAAYDPSTGSLVAVYDHIKAAAEANSLSAECLRTKFEGITPYGNYIWRKCPFDVPDRIEL